MAVLPNSSLCFDRLHSAHSADRGGFFTQVPFRLLPDFTGKRIFYDAQPHGVIESYLLVNYTAKVCAY